MNIVATLFDVNSSACLRFLSLADAYIKNRCFATGWLIRIGRASLEMLSRR